ncbi:MAG: hypothetical protein JSW71_11570 [Gemmatimonadota bacterium]|nr:MAG: hypothetical protein JSW71_11570 [Gemmatimonadota bacterium]
MPSRFALQRSIAMLLLGSAHLGGCATMRLHLRYGELASQTEMRESVFLALRSDLPPTVYVSETCAADEKITVRPRLDRELAASGYAMVETPDEATYVLQVNHVRLVETELSENQTVSDAIGSAFAAGFGTGVAADVFGASGDVAAGLGLAVGAIGFIADAHTKHLAHLLTTDVLVTETVPGGDSVALRRHATQIVSGAAKVNLRRAESLPVLVDGTSRALGRLLPGRSGDSD